MNYLTVSPLATYISYNRVREVEDPTDQLPPAVESDYLPYLISKVFRLTNYS